MSGTKRQFPLEAAIAKVVENLILGGWVGGCFWGGWWGAGGRAVLVLLGPRGVIFKVGGNVKRISLALGDL